MKKKKIIDLPRGFGSLQQRGRAWWLVYKDSQGKTVQQNTDEWEWNAAVRELARNAERLLYEKAALFRQLREGTLEARQPAPRQRAVRGRHARIAKRAGAHRPAVV